MFKNATYDIPHDDAIVKDLIFWMRTIWEHAISHYLYAAGLCAIFAFQQYSYKDAEYTILESISSSQSVDLNQSKSIKVYFRDVVVETNNDTRFHMKLLINSLIFLSAIVHGLVIAGAAIDFPHGIIVGLIYIIIGLIITFYYLLKCCNNNTNRFSNNINDTNNLLKNLYDIFINMHRRPIMLYFLWGFLIALLVVIIWIGIYGPITRSQAEVF